MSEVDTSAEGAAQKLIAIVNHPYAGHAIMYDCQIATVSFDDIRALLAERDTLRAQLATARYDALEEAASLCDKEHLRRKEQYKGRGVDDIQKERWRVAAQLSGLIADEIRSLKGPTP